MPCQTRHRLAIDDQDSLMQSRNLRSCWVVTIVCILSVWTLRAAADDTTIPPARTEYFGRRIAQTMHYTGAPWLVRESREREEEPKKLLDALTIKPGQTVCDIGCGNGFYTLRLARRVGERGTVYAVDIQQEMLDGLTRRAERQAIHNIRLTRGSLIDPRLPAGTMDLVLMVDVYHEFSHPQQMLSAIRKSLKPSGRIVLVEFRAEDPNVPIKPLHKMSKQQILKEIVPNGFRLDHQFDGLPWQHMMMFVREERRSEGNGHPQE